MLTKKQEKLLRLIDYNWSRYNRPPTLESLATAMQVQRPMICKRISSLVEKGLLQRYPLKRKAPQNVLPS